MRRTIMSMLLVVMLMMGTVVPTYAVTVSSAKIVSYPKRTTYVVGEVFDPKGLVVRTTYSDGSVHDISSGFPDKIISSGNTSVTYNIGGYSIEIPIKVITKTSQKDVNRNNISLNKKHVAYISGYDDGTFKPNKTLSRAEAAAMLCRIVSNPPSVSSKSNLYNTPFADVKSKSWYYSSVGFLYKNGVIGASEGDYFKADSPITRAEFAVYVSRFKSYKASNTQVFTDVPTSYWAAEEIAAVYSNGWISGYADKTFRPEERLTRAEAVSIINKMMNRKINDKSIAGKQIKYFSDVPSSHWAYYPVIEASSEHSYKTVNKLEVWD